MKKVDGKQQEVTKKWSFFEYAPYEYITYLQFEKCTKRVGCALRALGMNPGDKLELFAGTSMHWMIMAQGANTQSFPIVTAYDTLGVEGLKYSLNETEAKVVFTDAPLLNVLIQGLEESKITAVIYKGEPVTADLEKLKSTFPKLKVMTYEDLEKLGEENQVEPTPPKKEDLACIMYTSGSTGAPKGVLITHANIVAAIAGADKALNHHINKEDYLVAYLPLAHIFEFVFEMTALYWGATMGYATVKTLTDTNMKNCKGDLSELRPTVMVGVPAVWEMVRKGIVGKIAQAPTPVQKLFWGAVATKGMMTSLGLPGKGLIDATIFKKIKLATGGRLRFALNGGAPIAKETQQFLSMILCPLLSGYGLTETCAGTTIMSPEHWQPGLAGAPLACLELKLVDVPDAGYFSDKNPPQGEVWIRGGNVSSGYLNRPKENAEAYEDGWFKTGDVGQWEPNGLLRIIDRKKNLVKTRNGEYIAIEKLESSYRTCALAQNVCVYADQQQVKPVILVVVNEGPLRKWLETKGIKGDYGDAEDMCKDPKVNSAILAEMQSIGRKSGLAGIEIVAAAVLIHEEFTPQNGLVTNAQKLNRKKIQETFQKEIDEAYKSVD